MLVEPIAEMARRAMTRGHRFEQGWAHKVMDKDMERIRQRDKLDVVGRGPVMADTQQINAKYDGLVPNDSAAATFKIGNEYTKLGEKGFDVRVTIVQTSRSKRAPSIDLKLPFLGSPGDLGGKLFQGIVEYLGDYQTYKAKQVIQGYGLLP